MSDKPKKKNSNPNNVISLPTQCQMVDCKEKPRRLTFCQTHFEWFKEGLITRQGEKARDYDKKYQEYLRRKAKAA